MSTYAHSFRTKFLSVIQPCVRSMIRKQISALGRCRPDTYRHTLFGFTSMIFPKSKYVNLFALQYSLIVMPCIIHRNHPNSNIYFMVLFGILCYLELMYGMYKVSSMDVLRMISMHAGGARQGGLSYDAVGKSFGITGAYVGKLLREYKATQVGSSTIGCI